MTISQIVPIGDDNNLKNIENNTHYDNKNQTKLNRTKSAFLQQIFSFRFAILILVLICLTVSLKNKKYFKIFKTPKNKI